MKDGSNIVTRTNEDFRQVADSASRVADLVDDIAAASHEQSQGIDQVNIAVSEMDKVTQQNAATAEESASASEEMNAQARGMGHAVDHLVGLVGGNAKGRSANHSTTEEKQKPVRKMIPASSKDHGEREVRPEQVIPLDDEHFKDF